MPKVKKTEEERVGRVKNTVLRREGNKRYPVISPKFKRQWYSYAEPISGTNLETDSIIVLEIQAESYVGFGKSSLIVEATCDYDNPNYKEPPADLNDDARTPRQKLKRISSELGDDKESGAYMHPALGFSGLFRGVEVEINGTKVSEQKFGMNLYQVLNRMFTSKKLRNAYCEQPIADMLPCTSGKEEKSAGLVAGMQYMNSGAMDPASVVGVGRRVSLDSCFLLGLPKNLTALAVAEAKGLVSESETFDWSLIRPNSKIVIRLFKHDPVGRNVGNFLGHYDHKYHEGKARLSTDKGRYLDAKVKIKGVSLLYENYEFENQEKSIMGDVVRYTRDTFDIQIANLQTHERRCTQDFQIMGSCKLAYIAFPMQHSVYFDKSVNMGCEYMFQYPKNMERIRFKLNGVPYRFEDGLTGIGCPKYTEEGSGDTVKYVTDTDNNPGFGTRDALLFFQEQQRTGCFDNTFEEQFPR